jgi:hypothetical protein
VLRVAQEGLEEKGDPEELLRRHTVSLPWMVHLPSSAWKAVLDKKIRGCLI